MLYQLDSWRRLLAGPPGGPAQGADEPLDTLFAESYPDLSRDQAAARYRRLTETFLRSTGAREVSVARAPGRINLIGEHTDYNGLPVLPMAIDRDIAALFLPRHDGRIRLANTDSGFPERTFALEHSIAPSLPGDWANYCKAAVQGLQDALAGGGGIGGGAGGGGADAGGFAGFDAVIDGNIPAAAGMSSSSALVVLSALMFLTANGLEIDRLQLAELLAEAEKYVGTQGGGMDQAISLMGRPGCALKIDFFPLRAEAVPLPGGCRFVVANSLVRADKGAGAQDLYNRRPIECRLAVALLRESLARHTGREAPLARLGDLKPDRLGLPQAEIDALAAATLHPRPYGLAEIAEALQLSPEETARTYCRRRDGSIFPEPAEGFKLHARFRHVTEEGLRVEEAARALRAGEIERFGRLMNDSHASCRDLYEISCPELDRLVEIAREGGALGARLTGAGFGGCTVCLVRDETLPSFLAAVEANYYRGFLGRPEEPLEDILFPCRAAAGAQILPAQLLQQEHAP
ncbi:MAG: galactokinase [Spirochaetales bacterium]|nr:galactokinase [Spirochaetales bacterium]